ncbi:MAG: RNA polymerase sigma factor RpoD, partial [Clostridiales bacterium]|nr:RNA polymerase sigma factor RpoD [Candidatus Blautia equi]
VRNKAVRGSAALTQKLGRTPVIREIADEIDVPVKIIENILSVTNTPTSLNLPIGDNEEETLECIIRDERIESPEDVVCRESLKGNVSQLLKTLSDEEREIIILHFGLKDGREQTLSTIAEKLGCSRERTRLIEKQAFHKLLQPSRIKYIMGY